EDVPQVLKAFDVFMLPSVKEGLAIAAIEAQAVGLPTLLSTGVPEMANLTDAAQRIPLADGAQVWAEACINALHAERVYGKSIAAIRANGFDINDSAHWLLDFYRSVSKR
ncbi:MAG: glycosyltransferase, partial [Raoultibacter sp.]